MRGRIEKRYLNKILDTFNLLFCCYPFGRQKLHASTHFSDLNVCETVEAENAFNLPSGIYTLYGLSWSKDGYWCLQTWP